MQQVLGLKAVGTVSIRFSNSPITREIKGLFAGTHREAGPRDRSWKWNF